MQACSRTASPRGSRERSLTEATQHFVDSLAGAPPIHSLSPEAARSVLTPVAIRRSSRDTSHDWRKVEARLNALPQFVTEIDGLAVHFIRVRSKHDKALPMIVPHG